MAGHAPGYEQAGDDLQCYNCGMKGHLFFACPEDTRRVPAGLEASRKRQASANDYPTSIKRTKGPVVTHYPPPPPGVPHFSQPPTSYSSHPGYDHPGPPLGLPYQPPQAGHYDRYPHLNTGRSEPRGLSYDSSQGIHESHFGPSRAPPSETTYRQSYHDQYDQYRSDSPPNAPYGRPYSAPPNRYQGHVPGFPQGTPYAAINPINQAHLEHHPPAPGVENYYTHPSQAYPPPHSNFYRSPSQYHRYDGAPRPYTSSHGSPPLETNSYHPHSYTPLDPPSYHHARYDDRFTDRSLHERKRRNPRSQNTEPRSGEKQQKNERYGRTHHDSAKHRSRSDRRFLDRPPGHQSPGDSTPSAQSVKDSTAPEDGKPRQISNEAVLSSTGAGDELNTEDLDWEEEMIFKELPMKMTKDLIREPLPAEWTDDPIMPPKYDKETITSKYINPTNIDDFALSVRETKAWQLMQHHPAFLPPEEVCIEKLWDYNRALNSGQVYKKQTRQGANNAGGGKSRGKSWGSKARGGRQNRYVQNNGQNYVSSDDQFNGFRLVPDERSWDEVSCRSADDLGEKAEVLPKYVKISSPEPGEVCETGDQDAVSAAKNHNSQGKERHQTHQSRQDPDMSSSHDIRIEVPNAIREFDTRSLFQRAASSSPPSSHRHSSPTRPLSRQSSNGLSRPPSQHSCKSNPSQSSSRRSSVASPLTPNERELLGMRPYSSGSDTGRDSPTPQANSALTRSRQRPAKLHAAYQRRW